MVITVRPTVHFQITLEMKNTPKINFLGRSSPHMISCLLNMFSPLASRSSFLAGADVMDKDSDLVWGQKTNLVD